MNMNKKIKVLPDQVYYPQTIPDNTQELLDKAAEANNRRHEELIALYSQRESFKYNRILATDKDKYIHAIDTILEWMKKVKDLGNPIGNAGSQKFCTVDYYHFNFEGRMDVVSYIFEPFLNKLKKAGCFSDWTKQMYVRRNNYSFENVNFNKLKEYKSKLETKNKEKGIPNNSRDYQDWFGFEEKTFWLRKGAGQNFTINFNPKKGETTNPFFLMQALVVYIRGHGQVNNSYLTTIVPIQEIRNYLSKNYPHLKPSDWGKWIRFTRNNLNQKINDGGLVIIKNFDKQEQGYPFLIKIPLSTP
jgi:hypothetical protein